MNKKGSPLVSISIDGNQAVARRSAASIGYVAMKGFLTALSIVFVLATGSSVRAESPDDILVIANGTVPIESLGVDELREIFLKRRLYWDSSLRIVPINANEGTAIRDEFRKLVLSMSEAEEGRFWQDHKIRTGTTKPTEFSTVLKAVFKLKGSVGYVYRKDFRKSLTSLKVLKVLPASQ